MKGTDKHLTDFVRRTRKKGMQCQSTQREGKRSNLGRAVSSGLCKVMTILLRFEGFAESDQEKSQEGCSRQREPPVWGATVGRSTVGLRLREEMAVSRVNECREHRPMEMGPSWRDVGGRPWRLQEGALSSTVMKFWRRFKGSTI